MQPCGRGVKPQCIYMHTVARDMRHVGSQCQPAQGPASTAAGMNDRWQHKAWRLSTRQQHRPPTNIRLRQRPVVVGASLGCIRVSSDAAGMAVATCQPPSRRIAWTTQRWKPTVQHTLLERSHCAAGPKICPKLAGCQQQGGVGLC